jgi:mono/diheme cytochrome c family protein
MFQVATARTIVLVGIVSTAGATQAAGMSAIARAICCVSRRAYVKIPVPMHVISGFIASAVMLLAFTAYAQTPGGNAAARAVKNPVAATPVSVTAGAAAYKKYCAFCHGVDAKGNGPLAPKDSNPPSLVDATWTHGSTDGEIFHLIANGTPTKTVMVGFKGKMPDQDMWHIVNYLRSLGPKTAAR